MREHIFWNFKNTFKCVGVEFSLTRYLAPFIKLRLRVPRTPPFCGRHIESCENYVMDLRWKLSSTDYVKVNYVIK